MGSAEGSKAESSTLQDTKNTQDEECEGAEAIESREQTQNEERLQKLQTAHGATWDGPDDPQDPYNWPMSRKILIGLIYSAGQLITLMSASMIAAALHEIAHDLGISASIAQIAFSVYFLGLAIGPLLIAAWSELSGRKIPWIWCNCFYILWNSLCPVGNSTALMIVGRLLAGAGASVGNTLTAPAMADMLGRAERGKATAIASSMPYLGPALGPLVGGLVTQYVQWHWIFWIVSIADAVLTLFGAIMIKETYTPELLRRKAAAMGGDAAEKPVSVTKWKYWKALGSKFGANLSRPMHFLVRRPIIQIIALELALDFGIYCLLLSSFATLWQERYHQSELSSSLHYFSFSIGASSAAQIGGRIMDWWYVRQRDRHGRDEPEFRAPYMLVGAIILPVGVFWYGWSAQAKLHWIMPDIGAAVFVLGSFVFSQGILAYQLDEFAEYSASANAATRILSNLFGFAFPIFAPQLYDRLDYGWGNSLLGFVAVVVVIPVPIIFWYWGGRIRKAGRKD